jgi:hypothetical protein
MYVTLRPTSVKRDLLVSKETYIYICMPIIFIYVCHIYICMSYLYVKHVCISYSYVFLKKSVTVFIQIFLV